jgi:hypothetical protein
METKVAVDKVILTRKPDHVDPLALTLKVGEQMGAGFRLVGQVLAPPKKPFVIDGWMYTPIGFGDSTIDSKGWRVAEELVARGVSIVGYYRADEPRPPGDQIEEALERFRKAAKPIIGALGTLATVVVVGIAAVALLYVAVIASAMVLAVLMLPALVFADPALVICLSDGSLVDIYRFYE